MKQAVVLLTGFEPFDGDAMNPSWLVAQALHRRVLAGARVHAVQLPCCFGQSLEVLRAAIRRLHPVTVLPLGQAAGRAEFSLERVAINVDDARIPDNAGARPVDSPIVPGGPDAYFNTLPIKAMVAALRASGLPAAVSQSAGTFVCNHVFYGLQHALAATAVRSGFMHLPLLPEQAAARPGFACMALDDMVRGTRIALGVALRHGPGDLSMADGAVA